MPYAAAAFISSALYVTWFCWYAEGEVFLGYVAASTCFVLFETLIFVLPISWHWLDQIRESIALCVVAGLLFGGEIYFLSWLLVELGEGGTPFFSAVGYSLRALSFWPMSQMAFAIGALGGLLFWYFARIRI
jgi:hypothetical protein